ncbi:MAG: beta-galactosidase [Armatimonadota bacterium]
MRHLTTAALVLVLTASAWTADDIVWRFDTDGDFEGWAPANFRSVEVSDGMLRGVTEYDSQLLSPVLEIHADDYSVVEFRVSSSVTGGGEIFWHGLDDSFNDDTKLRHTIHASDEPRVYRSNLGDVDEWQGTISRLRLDVLNPADAEIRLDYVRLTNAPRGVVPNASFEDDFDDDGIPDGWAIDAAESAWAADHVVHGDRSLMVEARGPDHRFATATVRAPIDLTGLYRFNATVTRVQGGVRELAAELRFRDVFDRPLGDEVRLTAGRPDEEGRRQITGEFETPERAASAELALIAHSGGARVWWDEVALEHIVETPLPCEQPLESWNAHWIWAEATRGQDDVPAYFIHRFELPVPPQRVTSAKLQVTADDRYTMWFNGELLSESTEADGWREPELVDLQPHLVPGENVIAVEARDVSSAEGLLAEGAILWPRGSMKLRTGDDWRAAGEAPEGWTDPDFDSSDWPRAAVIAAAGSDPWGNVPYEYLGPREEVRLLEASLPAQIPAGERLTVSARVSHLPETAADNPVRLALLREGSEFLCWTRDVSSATRQLENAQEEPDGVAIGPIHVQLSRFVPPGTYSVLLGFPKMKYAAADNAVIGEVRVRGAAAAESRPKVAIEQHNGSPTLMIDGRPHPFMHYNESIVGERRVRNMASAGVHLYFVRADEIGWQGSDEWDYEDWDAKVMSLLMHDPEALIIPAFTISGRNQQWWLDQHEDQLARSEDGSTEVGIYHHGGRAISLASQVWREESGHAVRRFVEHCRSASYSSRIIGYLPASGVSWEWQHWGSVGDFDPTDYSEPMQEQFRAWVRARYESEEALRGAWRMPEVTFDTVMIPTVIERDAADHMLFRDPSEGRYVIDFYLFYQDVMADGILHYFDIIKRASKGQALAGTYYGYVITMLSGARRAGDSGHMALSRIIDSDSCDFLLSPWDYSLREVGQPTAIMSAVGSVLARGKLWGMESDLRTHLVTDPLQRRHGAPDHLTGTVSQLRRAFASAATKGLAVRWYDFSRGWISSDPRQAQVIGQLRDISDRWVDWDRSPETDGIAVVVDEDTPAAYLSHQIQAMQWLVYKQKAYFDRVGASWSVYLLDDVVAERVPKMRAYFFLNCFHMTDEERAYIDSELKSDGRTLTWFYAPGYIDEDLDVSRISELTGMDFREIEEMRSWDIRLNTEHPWAEGITDADARQPKIEIGPIFVPAADDDEVLGRWHSAPEGAASDLPGLVVRRHEDWTSVYSAGPILSPMLLKRICEDAGVRMPVAGTEPAYVSRNLIGLHSAVERTETLTFDEPTRVTNLVTGEILAAATTELEVQVPGPGTLLLRTERAY